MFFLLPGSVLFDLASSFPCVWEFLFSRSFLWQAVQPFCLPDEDTPFCFLCLPTTNSYTRGIRTADRASFHHFLTSIGLCCKNDLLRISAFQVYRCVEGVSMQG